MPPELLQEVYSRCSAPSARSFNKECHLSNLTGLESDADQPDENDDLEGVLEEARDPDGGSAGTGRRRRTPRVFPSMSFKEALFIADAIQTHGAGQPIRRLTLFEALGRSPEGGTTRRIITSSFQYGITTGGYTAEFLALTSDGAVASDPDSAPIAKLRARFQLAIRNVAPFNAIYEKYKQNRLPTVEVLRDAAREANIPEAQVAECVETFLANARELGTIRTIAGSEHMVSIEAVLERLEAEPASGGADLSGPLAEPAPFTSTTGQQIEDQSQLRAQPAAQVSAPTTRRPTVPNGDNLDDVCFVISPIGDPNSVERKHADLMLTALIEPALKELGLRAVRADTISTPGLITGQVMDHVARAKLVIADLSFGNPNVYYELALRHATRKPVVQIIRTGDKLPFDVGQYRTVVIDMTDIYVLVPQIDLHRQEIARQARAAVSEGATSESPLSQFYPAFWETIAPIS